MKKFLCLFTVMVLLLSCASASEEKEILFRGVEWGASVRDVKGSFDELIYWEAPEYGSCFGMDYWTTGKGHVYSGDICMSIQSQLTASNRINVAGMKASAAVMRFVKLSDDSEPKLIMGEYLFASGDTYDNYFDLEKKLTDLYGKSTSETMNFSTAFDYYNVWKDAQGNVICLYMHGSSIVSVRYISSEIDDLLSEAEEKYASDKNSNYNGL